MLDLIPRIWICALYMHPQALSSRSWPWSHDIPTSPHAGLPSCGHGHGHNAIVLPNHTLMSTPCTHSCSYAGAVVSWPLSHDIHIQQRHLLHSAERRLCVGLAMPCLPVHQTARSLTPHTVLDPCLLCASSLAGAVVSWPWSHDIPTSAAPHGGAAAPTTSAPRDYRLHAYAPGCQGISRIVVLPRMGIMFTAK